MAVVTQIHPGGSFFHQTHFIDGDLETPRDEVSCPRMYDLHKLNPELATQARMAFESRIFFKPHLSASRGISLSFDAGHLFWNHEVS